MALQKAVEIQHWLAGMGWPNPLLADSGNGAHLLYRIDLPNNTAVTDLIQRCLQALATQWDDPLVQIDVGNANAARIWKLYYTLTAKGDSTSERPHRWSQIIAAEQPMVVVSEQQLQRLAALAPDKPLSVENTQSHSHFDVDGWLAQHNVKAHKSVWRNGWRWRLADCPFNDAHRDGAYVVQLANGAISAGCHHHSCQGKSWRDLRALFDDQDQATQRPIPDSALQQLIRAEMAAALADFLTELRQELGQIAGRSAVPTDSRSRS